MVRYHKVRDVLECALHEHGPNASCLAGAVAELVRLEYRGVVYEGVYDQLRTAMSSLPRCACELAALEWRALPMEVQGSWRPPAGSVRQEEHRTGSVRTPAQ